jgi:hypothetical protein
LPFIVKETFSKNENILTALQPSSVWSIKIGSEQGHLKLFKSSEDTTSGCKFTEKINSRQTVTVGIIQFQADETAWQDHSGRAQVKRRPHLEPTAKKING